MWDSDPEKPDANTLASPKCRGHISGRPGGPGIDVEGTKAFCPQNDSLSESLLLFLAQSRRASPSGASRARGAVGSGPGGQRSPSQQRLSRSGCLTLDRHNMLLPSCKASACVSSRSRGLSKPSWCPGGSLEKTQGHWSWGMGPGRGSRSSAILFYVFILGEGLLNNNNNNKMNLKRLLHLPQFLKAAGMRPQEQ